MTFDIPVNVCLTEGRWQLAIGVLLFDARCSQCKDKHWNKWRWRKLLIISVLIEKVAHYQSQRGKRIKFSCRHGYGMERTRAYILNKIYWHFFIVCREFTIYYNVMIDDDINIMNLTVYNSDILQINVKNGWI